MEKTLSSKMSDTEQDSFKEVVVKQEFTEVDYCVAQMLPDPEYAAVMDIIKDEPMITDQNVANLPGVPFADFQKMHIQNDDTGLGPHNLMVDNNHMNSNNLNDFIDYKLEDGESKKWLSLNKPEITIRAIKGTGNIMSRNNDSVEQVPLKKPKVKMQPKNGIVNIMRLNSESVKQFPLNKPQVKIQAIKRTGDIMSLNNESVEQVPLKKPKVKMQPKTGIVKIMRLNNELVKQIPLNNRQVKIWANKGTGSILSLNNKSLEQDPMKKSDVKIWANKGTGHIMSLNNEVVAQDPWKIPQVKIQTKSLNNESVEQDPFKKPQVKIPTNKSTGSIVSLNNELVAQDPLKMPQENIQTNYGTESIVSLFHNYSRAQDPLNQPKVKVRTNKGTLNAKIPDKNIIQRTSSNKHVSQRTSAIPLSSAIIPHRNSDVITIANIGAPVTASQSVSNKTFKMASLPIEKRNTEKQPKTDENLASNIGIPSLLNEKRKTNTPPITSRHFRIPKKSNRIKVKCMCRLTEPPPTQESRIQLKNFFLEMFNQTRKLTAHQQRSVMAGLLKSVSNAEDAVEQGKCCEKCFS